MAREGILKGKNGPKTPWHKRWMAERRKEAEARQAYRDKLSPAQQIAVLDKRLGKDVGAKKERARLQKLL